MTATLEEYEQRLEKRRETDMIVKMRIDQLQRENVFVSSSRLDAVLRMAENALATVVALENRVVNLEAEIAPLKK